MIQVRNEFFDLIGWEADSTYAYGPAYGPGNTLT